MIRVRKKQNKYPILFLTQGVTDLYPELMDIRCQSTKIAMSFAQSENILVRERTQPDGAIAQLLILQYIVMK